jgi:flagellar export protein FliJ
MLRQFRYSLETLLRYREDIEERERDKLHRLTYQHQVEDNIRKRLAKELQETMHDMVAMCADKSRDKELTWFHLYLNRLTREIGESDKSLAQLKSAIEAQRKTVIEASKNKKALTSMKAKKEKEFNVELDRSEQKEIDDLVVTSCSRTGSKKQSSVEIQGWKKAV